MSKEIVLNKMYVVKDASCIKGALFKEGDVLIAIGDVNTDFPDFFNTRTEKKVTINRYRVEPLKAELKGATASAMILDESSALPNSHYQTTIQPIETMQSNMSPEAFQGYLRGNIIKYACRIGKKDEQLKEAKKILEYAKWLVESIEGKTIDPRPKVAPKPVLKTIECNQYVGEYIGDNVIPDVKRYIESELILKLKDALSAAEKEGKKLLVSPVVFSRNYEDITRMYKVMGRLSYQVVEELAREDE